jgi:hypothetical protein
MDSKDKPKIQFAREMANCFREKVMPAVDTRNGGSLNCFMNKKNKRYILFSPEQELLLRAALLRGRDAIEAWKEWKSSVDIEQVDHASHRMLPLLYRNLQAHGVKDPSMAKYKGVYRQTWYKNQILFHAIASLLRSFRDENIQTLMLKGAALTMLYYKDYGLRPMNDIDVLIRMEKVLPAIKMLQKLGWTPVYFAPTEEYISVSHSHGFRNSAGQEFDLHWHVLSQSRETNADVDFWEGAITADFHGIATHALNPADQLLHVCIHGARWNYTPPFRWVADAMSILNAPQSKFDWNRLIAQSRKRRLILPMRESLNYLRNLVDAPVPTEIVRIINDLPIPGIERIEYRVNMSPPSRRIAGIDLWCQHSRLMGDKNLFYKLIRFPEFLGRIWGQSLWKLPFYAMSKVMTWRKTA